LSVCLEFANGAQPQQCGMPRGEPLTDMAGAVSTALESPLGYPPLRQTATPGDRVVLSVGRGVPQVAQVTAAVVDSLMAAGVEPDGISVLRTEADLDAGGENPCRLLQGVAGQRIRLLTHDPLNRGNLAYLAATDQGEPILLNRLLTDADLVLPIDCLQAERTPGYFGIHSSIFPDLSDQRTQVRFRQLAESAYRGPRRRELAREVDQVAWLLGINFTIQLVPAAGDGVLGVVAGESTAVRRRGRELYRAAWASGVARRTSLVVATIEGGARQQTWENLGRALARATRLAEDGGAVAVCCELAAQPGPALQRLVGARSRQSVLRQIRRECPADALPATQLARALDHGRVYLLSRLDPALVEDLEMVPVGGPEELARLARRNHSCTLLANAAQAIVTVEND
jgi:nickel-dependent lactate racemase